MKIQLASVLVNDQDKALRFYTEVLGFVVKEDVAVAGGRWIAVVSPELPHGPRLVLEPASFGPARTYQRHLYEEMVPATAFAVDDVPAEYARLRARGVAFSMAPEQRGTVVQAVFDDTCGNWMQIYEA